LIDLSVIIVSYNTKKLLGECLESVFQSQGPKFQIEVTVVDNGSTDGSMEMVRRKYKAVKVIENEKNLGFAKAVNQGFKQSQGRNLLLLNSDAEIQPQALEKLFEFEKKVGPAIIGAKMLNPDGTVQASVFNLPTAKRAVEEFWFGKDKAFSKYAPAWEKPVAVEAVSGGAMLISGAIIKKIGLFDERYFMYYEDLDFCRRAKKAGYKIWYLPEATVIHYHGASGRQLASPETQWKRLIPSSKIYHGAIRHWLITQIIKVGQLVGKSGKSEK